MKGSRSLGAMLGATLALTAGGIAVGFSSHPVGDSSIGVAVGAGVYDFAYGHASGETRGADLDVFLIDFQGNGAYNGTEVGPRGYESRGGPDGYNFIYASVQICEDGCRSWSGRFKQVARSESIDSSYVSYAGYIDGELVAIDLTEDGDLRAAEFGEHYIEPGYPAIWVGEGVATYRPMRVRVVTVGDASYSAERFRHNHGVLYRQVGAGLEVSSFTRARSAG